MKKSKLLTSLVSASALVGAIAPTITLTGCNKTQEIVVSDVNVVLKDITTDVVFGQQITRDNFVVTAVMSDGSTKDVNDWTCDKLDSFGKYTFQNIGSDTLTIKYQTFSVDKEFAVGNPVELKSMASTITMPRSNSQTEFESETIIKVFCNGTRVIDNLYFSIESGSSVEIVNNRMGTIKTKADGETTIKVNWGSASNLSTTVKINVSSAYINILDLTFDDTNREVSVAPSNATGDYVIPEVLVKNDVTYYVTTVKKSVVAGASVNSITALHIPETVTEIESDIFSDPESKLQDIYFAGTEDEWNERFGTTGSVGGAQTIGVWTTNGFLTFDNCVDSLSFDLGGKEVLATTEPVGGYITRQTYTARFSYAKLKNNQQSTYQKIVPYNSTWQKVASISVIAIWVDGTILDNTSTELPKWSINADGAIEFDFSASGTPLFTATTNIVVEFKTAVLAEGSVYLAAEPKDE